MFYPFYLEEKRLNRQGAKTPRLEVSQDKDPCASSTWRLGVLAVQTLVEAIFGGTRNVSLIVMLFCGASIAGLSQAQIVVPATQPALSAADQQLGAGKVVGEDYFYNHQERNGKQFHYIWDDTAVSGMSKFGDVFKQYGANLGKLEKAANADDLKKFSVYLIINPATPAKAPNGKPNYMTATDADAIEAWVKAGGVLGMFANDKNNCEIEHYDILANRFGITFNNDLRNEVPNARDRLPGTWFAAQFPDHPIFKDVKAVYMKEVCTLQVTGPAKALLVVPKEKKEGEGTDIIMAEAHVGKGLVFAVGDPWEYNEYIDVPATATLPLENRKAAYNLAKYFLEASAPPMAK
jgi:unsaturated rhamnogalacturonyl hydrolase